jgi:hypothetical protein
VTGFSVTSLLTAVIASLIIAVISFILNRIV